MNGRVYDPLLARFGTADPMTESPFSTQGWNRYSYVGNSPLNFTDPSGYCFMGCFWQSAFRAIQRAFRAVPILGMFLQIAACAICGPPCAILASAFVAGVTSGSLAAALRAGFISAVTFGVMQLGSELLGLGGAPAAAASQSAAAPPSFGGNYMIENQIQLPGINIYREPPVVVVPAATASAAASGGEVTVIAQIWHGISAWMNTAITSGAYLLPQQISCSICAAQPFAALPQEG